MIAAYICTIPSQYHSHQRARCLQLSNRWLSENSNSGYADLLKGKCRRNRFWQRGQSVPHIKFAKLGVARRRKSKHMSAPGLGCVKTRRRATKIE